MLAGTAMLGARIRDLGLLIAILAIAGAIRVGGPRAEVFTSGGVNFLDADGWYHLRLVENQVRNFPFRVTHDSYASPDGMFVPVAPLFDTVIAAAALLTGGSAAGTEHLAMVAAFVPPVLGVLSVALVFVLGRLAFGRRAALLAAALSAILPGHFLDRTLLGYVDHHALEVLLALAVLVGFARVAASPSTGPLPLRSAARAALLPGTALGLYLLAWGSGAFLVAALGAWLAVQAVLDDHVGRDDGGLIRVAGVSALVALAWVLLFQHPDMHRYWSQVVGAVGLAGGCLAVDVTRARTRGRWGAIPLLTVGAVLGLTTVVALALGAPAIFRALLIDVWRFTPDPQRMSVLEARPLFLFSGDWNWGQPWIFFRTGFYLGTLGLLGLAVSGIRRARPRELMVSIWGLLMLAATLGQNRFGYYLVPALALGTGWLGARVLDWGGVPEQGVARASRTTLPFSREIAVVAVAGLAFGPNLVPALNTTARGAPLTPPWRDAMAWLRTATPEPFGDPEYYLARYGDHPRVADYSVMAWWDYGYWILQQGRRVPVSNPTQAGAHQAARFFEALDEAEALAILDRERARYVAVDFAVPYSIGATGFRGKYHALAAWTGTDASRDYAMYFEPDGAGGVRPVPLFHETYYQSMAFRLYAAGGGSLPARAPATIVRWQAQATAQPGVMARTIAEIRDFERLEDARRYLTALGPGPHALVGRDPLRPPVAVPALDGLRLAWDSPQRYSDLHGLPAIRIFERVAER